MFALRGAPMTAARTFLTQVLSWALLTAVIAGALALIVVPKVAGATPLTVLSGSMTGAYEIGDVVIVKPVEPDELAIGDVITFQAQSDDPTLTTHRIVGLAFGSEGTEFVTQGDANNAADLSPIKPAQVRGEVWYSVPLVGYVSVWLAGGWMRNVVDLIAVGPAPLRRWSSPPAWSTDDGKTVPAMSHADPSRSARASRCSQPLSSPRGGPRCTSIDRGPQTGLRLSLSAGRDRSRVLDDAALLRELRPRPLDHQQPSTSRTTQPSTTRATSRWSPRRRQRVRGGTELRRPSVDRQATWPSRSTWTRRRTSAAPRHRSDDHPGRGPEGRRHRC